MFEAYKIGIRLSLINGVSSGLSVISSNFKQTHAEAVAFQKQLKEIKLLGLTGGIVGGLGFMGLGIIGKAIKPAEEYAHQLNIMNMAGLKQREIAEAVGDSWANSGKILTTTVTSNLRDLLDLRNIMGDMQEARMALPIFTKIQAVMGASHEEKVSKQSQGFAYSMAKALDIVGAVRDPKEFLTQAEMMSKVIIATQGRVTPEAFKSVFQYARQAKIPLGNEFKYEILPTLIQENATSTGAGGGSRGVGPMLAAFYRWTNQGLINKKVIPELESLGLIAKGAHLKTTTSGTTLTSPMKDSKLAAYDPFRWIMETAVPAIYKKYGNISDIEMTKHLVGLTTGNQLAGSLMSEFFFKNKNFLRDQRIIRGTMNSDDALHAAMSNDPVTARKALSSQWTNVKTAFTLGLVPILVPTLINVAKGMNWLAQTLREHPRLTKTLAIGLTALAASMAFSGTIMMLTAGFRGISLVLGIMKVGQYLPSAATGLLHVTEAVKDLSSTTGIGRLVTSLIGPLGLVAAVGISAYAIMKLSEKMADNRLATESEQADMARRNGFGAPISTTKGNFGPTWRPVPARDNVRPGTKGKYIQLTSHVSLDGRTVAKVVSQHQANEAEGPQHGIGSYDSHLAPSPVGF